MNLKLASDSIFAGTARMQALTRWLQEMPPEAAYLAISVRDRETQSAEVLARWSCQVDGDGPDPSVAAEWAAKAEALIQDYAREVRGKVVASIRWLDAGNAVISQKRLEVMSEADGDPFNSFEASAQTVLAQTQAHQQVLMESFTQAMQYVVIETGKRQDAAYDRQVKLERELERLKRENEDLRNQAIEEAAGQAIEEAQERDPTSEKAEKLFEVLVMKYLASNSGKPPATDG